MSDNLNVAAATRKDFGKGASRRLRRENLVPAILYGAEDDPQPIQLKHNEVVKHLSDDGFYAQLLMVSVDGGEPVRSILRDVQRHPHKQQILHMDFQRVVAGAELTVNVPIHWLNEDTCIGVKADGGIISHLENEVAVLCRPRDIPEFLEVDMANVAVGDTVTLLDITFPEGVRSVDLTQGEEDNRTIAAVNARKTVEEETAEDEAAAETGDAPAEGGEPAADSGDGGDSE